MWKVSEGKLSSAALGFNTTCSRKHALSLLPLPLLPFPLPQNLKLVRNLCFPATFMSYNHAQSNWKKWKYHVCPQNIFGAAEILPLCCYLYCVVNGYGNITPHDYGITSSWLWHHPHYGITLHDYDITLHDCDIIPHDYDITLMAMALPHD